MAKYEMVEVKDQAGREIVKMMNVGALRISTFAQDPEEIADRINNVVNLPLRDDDVMFCSAPKSGSHWAFEIISMLLSGTAETIQYAKESLLLETIPPEQLDEKTSPRLLNSHLPFHMLPRQLKEKKTKIVLCLRNPKDLCTSYYHHHIGIKPYCYDGEFKDYIRLFLAGELDYGDWFDYVLEMEEIIKKGEYNIHLVYYEDLKENGPAEIKRLSTFLKIPASDTLCAAINAKCSIVNMVKDKEYSPEDVDKYFREGFRFYRKGEIGDWKNIFTVAMSEEFDKVYNERMKNSQLQFRFTSPDP